MKCPYCGSKAGLYSKDYVIIEQYYDWNGDTAGYSDPELVKERKSTPLYCQNCDRYVGKYEKLFPKGVK